MVAHSFLNVCLAETAAILIAAEHSIYRNQTQLRKDPEFYFNMSLAGSIVSETDPRRHQEQAAQINPVLRQNSIENRIDVLVSKANIACRALYGAAERGEPVDIQRFFQRVMVSRTPGIELYL